jgi:hypothetical protein
MSLAALSRKSVCLLVRVGVIAAWVFMEVHLQ